MIHAPLRGPAIVRLISALTLFLLLAVACGGSFLARSSEGEPPSGEVAPVDARSGSGAAAAAAPAPPVASVTPAGASTTGGAADAAGSAPTAALTPTPRPTADLQASLPAPDPQLPSWAVNTRETGLWSGPSDGTEFTRVPQGATFRVFERQGGRFKVFYPGDRRTRQPGEVWVDAADLAGVAWPRWVRMRRAGTIVTKPSGDGVPIASLRGGDFVEVVGEARGAWARVYFLGDGRASGVDGWLEVDPVAPIAGPDVISTFALSRELLSGNGPEVWLKVPYRSQIDGSAYWEANCGPTTVNMVLESFGISVPQPALRQEVLALQPAENCDDCGVYIQNMAEVIARRGLQVRGLRDGGPDAKPDSFHAWSQDEIRAELRAGRPVVVQIWYRALPGRASSAYWGDHYVVLTGFVGDRFIFNDPIDADGPGYSRLISSEALNLGMRTSDYPYAGFAVEKG